MTNDEFTQAFHAFLKERIEQITTAEAKKAADEVERRVREEMGSIACRLAQTTHFEWAGPRLHITVEFPSHES